MRQFWTLEGPEKTVDGSLICEELNMMVFVVGVLLCRPESCLGCRFPYFRVLRVFNFFQIQEHSVYSFSITWFHHTKNVRIKNLNKKSWIICKITNTLVEHY